MSDDDRDDRDLDMDSDEEGSGMGSGGGQDKRAHHNALVKDGGWKLVRHDRDDPGTEEEGSHQGQLHWAQGCRP